MHTPLGYPPAMSVAIPSHQAEVAYGPSLADHISWCVLPRHFLRQRKEGIFKSKRDREKFLEYLQSTTERYNALIHAFYLMANHYHLLLETPSGILPQIMRHINGAYTTYFNSKRARRGHLFQGRYKAILVDKDSYAKELSRYIHLNPVRAAMVKTPGAYPWSSYNA